MTISLLRVFAGIPDPRRETENKRHLLGDLLVIAPCAVTGWSESWESIAEYGWTTEAFFRHFLAFPNGITCAESFERDFAKLDPKAFAWHAEARPESQLVGTKVGNLEV
jgi:hypothetical protein